MVVLRVNESGYLLTITLSNPWNAVPRPAAWQWQDRVHQRGNLRRRVIIDLLQIQHVGPERLQNPSDLRGLQRIGLAKDAVEFHVVGHDAQIGRQLAVDKCAGLSALATYANAENHPTEDRVRGVESCVSHTLELRLEECRQQGVDLQQALAGQFDAAAVLVDRHESVQFVAGPRVVPVVEDIDAELVVEVLGVEIAAS